MNRTRRTPPPTPQANSPLTVAHRDNDNITYRNKNARRSDADLNESTSEGMLAPFQNLMKRMFDEFEARQSSRLDAIEKQMSVIKKQNDSIGTTNLTIEKSIAEVSARLDDVNSSIARIDMERKQISSEISKLTEKCEALDRSLRKTSVEIRNVPKVKGEKLEDLYTYLQMLYKQLGVDHNSSHIRDIYRLPSKREHNTSTIIVDLVNTLSKTNLLNAARKFYRTKKVDIFASSLGINAPDTQIYISEHLTAKNRRLLHMAKDLKREGNFAFCWTAGGNVFLKKTEGTTSILIRNEEQVLKLQKSL